VRAGWCRRDGHGFAAATGGGRTCICDTGRGGWCEPHGDGIRITDGHANADADCFAVAHADQDCIA